MLSRLRASRLHHRLDPIEPEFSAKLAALVHGILVATARGIVETRNIRLAREDQKLYACTTHGTFVKQYLHGATPETRQLKPPVKWSSESGFYDGPLPARCASNSSNMRDKQKKKTGRVSAPRCSRLGS